MRAVVKNSNVAVYAAPNTDPDPIGMLDKGTMVDTIGGEVADLGGTKKARALVRVEQGYIHADQIAAAGVPTWAIALGLVGAAWLILK